MGFFYFYSIPFLEMIMLSFIETLFDFVWGSTNLQNEEWNFFYIDENCIYIPFQEKPKLPLVISNFFFH